MRQKQKNNADQCNIGKQNNGKKNTKIEDIPEQRYTMQILRTMEHTTLNIYYKTGQ